MELVGRVELVERVTAPKRTLTLLTGDSGSGKSALLKSALSDTGECHQVRCLRQLNSHSGSLQIALLELLAEACCLERATQSGIRQVVETTSRAARKVAEVSATEMGRIACKSILGYIRSKIGDEAAEAIEVTLKSLSKANDSLLEERLRASADQDAVKALMAFAGETHAIVGDLVLLFDRGERLTDSDFGLLMDLEELLPPGVKAIAAVSVHDVEQSRRIRRARSRGIEELPLPPLTHADIEEWLGRAGIDRAWASEVGQVSGGYPLFIEAATNHIASGKDLQSLPVDDPFAAITEQAWLGLSTEARACARLLVGFVDPPPTYLIESLLSVSPNVWYTVREELENAKIFSVEVRGQPWFHDRRRYVIWEIILRADDRREIAESVTGVLQPWIVDEPELDVILARLAPYAPSYRLEHAGVGEVLALGRPELAHLFALIELMEPTSSEWAFVDTMQLIYYTRKFFGSVEDSIGSVERLSQSGLVYLAADNRASIITTTIPSAAAKAVTFGRSLQQFGRKPLPRAASAAFQLGLEPCLAPFDQCVYGIGQPHLGAKYRELWRGGHGRVARYPPAVSMRGRYGERRVYLTATFSSATNRDSAVEKLKRLDMRVFDEDLQVEEVLSLPTSPLPAHRFLAAASELTEQDVGLPMGNPPSLEESIEAGKAAEARVRIHTIVRQRMSGIEAAVSGLDRSLCIGIARDPKGGHLMADILGAAPRVAALDLDSGVEFNDPLIFAGVAGAARLVGDETVSHVSASSGPLKEEPYLSELHRIAKIVKSFNDGQRPLQLSNDREWLERELFSALALRYEDALALWEGGVRIGPAGPPKPKVHYILLYPPGPKTLRLDGWLCDDLETEGDAPAAYVRFLGEAPEHQVGGRSKTKLIEECFGVTAWDHVRWSEGVADGIIADLLGHDRGAVRLWRPDVLGKLSLSHPQD